MSKYYDLDKLKDMIEAKAETLIGDGAIAFHAVGKWLDHLPAADVEPVIHGHWIYMDTYRTVSRYKCSECERVVTQKENSCPRCFARMDEEVKE